MLIDDIALSIHPNIGTKTVVHLLQTFGSAEAVYAATENELRERGGLKAAAARSIVRREAHPRAEAELEFLKTNRVRAAASDTPGYPQRLLECGDYPHVIYYTGEIDFNAGRWLAIVGTRNISAYGHKACERLIGELHDMVPDLVIVSGLAYGVDVAAHRAALARGIPTVGILGHPINRIQPAAHTDTARRMVNNGGAVLTEFSSREEPQKSGYVQRNRIIAGISEGTLVVESAAVGGSLITADMADGYHRTLLAVPGRIGDVCSKGPNDLIRSLKAQMVCCGRDIAEAMGWEPAAATNRAVQAPLFGEGEANGYANPKRVAAAVAPARAPLPANLSPEAATLLSVIPDDEPATMDDLTLAAAEIPAAELPLLLLDLEFAGKIQTLPGSRYLRI